MRILLYLPIITLRRITCDAVLDVFHHSILRIDSTRSTSPPLHPGGLFRDSDGVLLLQSLALRDADEVDLEWEVLEAVLGSLKSWVWAWRHMGKTCRKMKWVVMSYEAYYSPWDDGRKIMEGNVENYLRRAGS